MLALSRNEPLALGEEDQELFAEAQERRRAAEAAERRYRELFDRNLAGIIRATREGRILDPAERARVVLPLRAGERNSAAFR